MGFNAKSIPQYMVGDKRLNQVEESCCLGITLQANFDTHICNRISKAKQQLGMFTGALDWTPSSTEVLAYKSLFWPHIEYTSTA